MESLVKHEPFSEETINKILKTLKFTKDGLISVVSQQYDTGEILMVAWMNHDAIKQTLRTGDVVYWSRSRQSLWRKGEISGQTQTLFDFRWDCDSDCLLILINQKGVACHTGRRSCFYNAVRNKKLTEISLPEIDQKILYKKIEQ